jgi:leucyl aminopeptidase
MQVQRETGNITEIATGALVVIGFEKDAGGLGTSAQLINGLGGDQLFELYTTGEMTGKLFETALFYRPSGVKARRLLLIGAGKRESFTPAEMRKVAGAALRFLKKRRISDISLAIDNDFAGEDFVQAATEGAILGNFDPDRLKTDKDKDIKQVSRFRVAVPAGVHADAALTRGRILAESQNFARELVNQPANLLTPSALAGHAREMASEFALGCEVLNRDAMQKLGMGALLGVAQGSAEPPYLVVLRYTPSDVPLTGIHLGLIGKGVTFDTGGISIKPSEKMDQMKYDMAGGAAVLGAMRAIAQLKPLLQVTAVIPIVENMPGSRSQRPGDIVTAMSGKTVEVLNTDAEGRLILADALAYAIREGCTHLVDAATLTGAIVVALGHIHTGLFTNHPEFQERVLISARAKGENMWPMPLDDDYKDYLKSAFADIPNIGGRWGGAVTAAMFLKEFVEEKPWVHLDIAGTAWLEEEKPFLAKGPSGVAVRTFANLAHRW